MRCIKCGAIMDINVAFCGRCGTNSRVSSQKGYQKPQPQYGGGGVSAPPNEGRVEYSPKEKHGNRKGGVSLGFGIISIIVSGFNFMIILSALFAFLTVIFWILGIIFAITFLAFVMTPLGLVLSWTGVISGLLGIILGRRARKILTEDHYQYYVALGGIITGAIGFVLSLFFAILVTYFRLLLG